MTNLHPQFELLIRYADGNADAEMQQQARELISSDTAALDFYQSLQATALPNEEIYAPQAGLHQTELPQDIIDQINRAQPDDDSHLIRADHPRQFGSLALAASLFCGLIGGALLYGAATGIDPANDPVSQMKSSPVESAVVVQGQTPEWVRLVADYHRLYVRGTITAGARESSDSVSRQVSEKLQVNFKVPSLEQQGIEFRRAQWLAIDNQPLLQLAYLPPTGKPLAVCVLKKTTLENTDASYGETGGMQYVHWQTGEHAIVIVGTVSRAEMRNIYGTVEQQLL